MVIIFTGPGRQPVMALYNHIIGWQYLDNQHYTEAIQSFKAGLPGHPFQVEALNNIAYSNYQLGDKQEALNYYWLITEQDPKNYKANLSIARILRQMGWPKDALKVYEQLLYYYPGDKNLMREAASIYFETAFKNSQDYTADLTRSYKLFYDGFLNVHPELPLNPWLEYAETAYRLKYYDTAIYVYCAILPQPNTPPEATYLFAKSLEAKGSGTSAQLWMKIATHEIADNDPLKAQKWFQESHLMSLNTSNSALKRETQTQTQLSAFQQSCLDTLALHPKYIELIATIAPAEITSTKQTSKVP